jgi:hypothetical protein
MKSTVAAITLVVSNDPYLYDAMGEHLADANGDVHLAAEAFCDGVLAPLFAAAKDAAHPVVRECLPSGSEWAVVEAVKSMMGDAVGL